MAISRPALGHGVGLRPKHYSDFLAARPAVDWVEATSENYFAAGGRPVAALEHVRAQLPVVLHGVSMAIGSVAPLDRIYFRALRALIDRIEPVMVTDHLCWGRHGARYVHDLWPLPYTAEALAHVVARVQQAQDLLGRQLALENVSSYVTFHDNELTEWDFLSEVAAQADCGILLDVNNVYVSARNHGFDAQRYIDGLPRERVVQLHLAGHSVQGQLLIDTHDAQVPPAVWDLYRYTVARLGPVATLVEWDDHIPPLDVVLVESAKARAVEAEVLSNLRREVA